MPSSVIAQSAHCLSVRTTVLCKREFFSVSMRYIFIVQKNLGPIYHNQQAHVRWIASLDPSEFEKADVRVNRWRPDLAKPTNHCLTDRRIRKADAQTSRPSQRHTTPAIYIPNAGGGQHGSIRGACCGNPAPVRCKSERPAR